MACLGLGGAGLYWHAINPLNNGVTGNDTPEAVAGTVFEVFERDPDMPALLLYVVEGYGMANALMSRYRPHRRFVCHDQRRH